MTDPLTAEAIYLRLGSLIANTPDFKVDATPEIHRWTAQVLALIEEGKLLGTTDISFFKIASQNLQGATRDTNANTILAIAHQALAKVELRAPAELQGAFIAAGHSFDAFAAVPLGAYSSGGRVRR